MTKNEWIDVVMNILGWGVAYLIVQWLVDGSFWLNAYLASGVTGVSYASIKIRKLKEEVENLRSAYLITDEQLIKVSAQVEDYEDRIDSLERQVKDLGYFKE